MWAYLFVCSPGYLQNKSNLLRWVEAAHYWVCLFLAEICLLALFEWPRYSIAVSPPSCDGSVFNLNFL